MDFQNKLSEKALDFSQITTFTLAHGKTFLPRILVFYFMLQFIVDIKTIILYLFPAIEFHSIFKIFHLILNIYSFIGLFFLAISYDIFYHFYLNHKKKVQQVILETLKKVIKCFYTFLCIIIKSLPLLLLTTLALVIIFVVVNNIFFNFNVENNPKIQETLGITIGIILLAIFIYYLIRYSIAEYLTLFYGITGFKALKLSEKIYFQDKLFFYQNFIFLFIIPGLLNLALFFFIENTLINILTLLLNLFTSTLGIVNLNLFLINRLNIQKIRIETTNPENL